MLHEKKPLKRMKRQAKEKISANHMSYKELVNRIWEFSKHSKIKPNYKIGKRYEQTLP